MGRGDTLVCIWIRDCAFKPLIWAGCKNSSWAQHCTAALSHYNELSFYFNPANRYEPELKPHLHFLRCLVSPPTELDHPVQPWHCLLVFSQILYLIGYGVVFGMKIWTLSSSACLSLFFFWIFAISCLLSHNCVYRQSTITTGCRNLFLLILC